MATVSKSSLTVKNRVTSFPYTVGASEYVIATYYVSATGAGQVPIGTIAEVYVGPADTVSSGISVSGTTYSIIFAVIFQNS